MSDLFNLIPVRPKELAVGKPLPWPIYDWHGNLLLAAGVVIESQSQLEGLIGTGFIHDPRWDIEVKKPTSVSAPLMSKAKKVHPEPEEKPAPADKEVVMDLDDVKWVVGETMYMQAVDNSNVRYTVRLIGYVKNKSVIVTAPVLDGKFEFIRDGQAFVVRAFSGKKAFAFLASAVKSVHTPYPYLHLSYPKEMRCTVVRRGIRAQVKIIASVSLGDPERTGAATLLDLSTGGTSGILKEQLGRKDDEGRIKFKLHVAETDEYMNLKAILRSVGPAENGEGFRHGFEFIDTTVRDRLVLTAYVHQALVEAE
ncbi:MAG TPA: flagellar brake protein [Paucimonas sp.]|nr:flagellar brake protein [Paucimonas sp.]